MHVTDTVTDQSIQDTFFVIRDREAEALDSILRSIELL